MEPRKQKNPEKQEKQNFSANHWRYLLMHINLSILLLMPFVELGMFSYLNSQGMVYCTPAEYLQSYVLLPLCLNLAAVLTGYLLLRYSRIRPEYKDGIPVLVLSALCFCIMYVHSVFVVTLSIFTVPVVVSGMFGRKRITNVVAIFNLCLLVLGAWLPKASQQVEDRLYASNFFLAILIFLVTYFLTLVVIAHNCSREDNLRKSNLEQKRLQQDLLMDGLTGIYNRAAYEKFLEEFRRRFHTGEMRAFSLAMVDIDDFKAINDTYGHMNGDQVLQRLSRLFLEELKETGGKVFRYGGEEFVVLFPEADLWEARLQMERILKRFRALSFDFDPTKKISFSCGIKSCETPADEEKNLLALADEAMYQAKAKGKNRVLLCF